MNVMANLQIRPWADTQIGEMYLISESSLPQNSQVLMTDKYVVLLIEKQAEDMFIGLIDSLTLLRIPFTETLYDLTDQTAPPGSKYVQYVSTCIILNTINM